MTLTSRPSATSGGLRLGRRRGGQCSGSGRGRASHFHFDPALIFGSNCHTRDDIPCNDKHNVYHRRDAICYRRDAILRIIDNFIIDDFHLG